jgi:DNA anti-recombination protein RmuC
MAVFSEAFLRLRQDLDQSHESRQKLIADIRNNVRDMARQTGDQLAEQGRSRRADFTAMITELRRKIGQQAAETRGQLADLAADLRQGGAIFAAAGGNGRLLRRASRNR